MRLKQGDPSKFRQVKEMGIADPDKVLQQRKGTLESIITDAPEAIQHILQPITRDLFTRPAWVAGEAAKLSPEMAAQLLVKIQGLYDTVQQSQSFGAKARDNLRITLDKVSKICGNESEKGGM